MELIYDTEDGNFTVDIEDTHRSDNFITYIIPTQNPEKDFRNCLNIASEMNAIHPNLLNFVYEQLNKIPETFIHTSLYNLSLRHNEDLQALSIAPPHDSNDHEEKKLKDSYVSMLDNELKHIKKYLKLSDQVLRTKAYLGIIEVNAEQSLGRFYLDNIAEAVLTLSFTLTRNIEPTNPGDDPAKRSPNSLEPTTTNNIISLTARRKPDAE